MPTKAVPHIVHLVHSLRGGGTERTLVKLLNAFDDTRFRHSVATLRDCGSLAERLPDDVACRPLNAGARNRLLGVRLARLLRAQKADILHARGFGCWFDATMAGLLAPNTRIVLGFHGLEKGPSLDKRLRRRARWGMRGGARFTSVSQAGRSQLIAEAGISPEQITVLPNGVDLTRFSQPSRSVRDEARGVWRLGVDTLVAGIVGSLVPVKGHATLVRSVADLIARGRKVHLLVVGDGPLRAELEDRVRAAGIEKHVTFTGWSDAVPTLLHAMDLYVCCSHAEGMNNTMLEALAVGLPIIATDVGDNATVVRNGREGLIVKPGSVEAMTGALSTLAASPDLRRRWGTAARQRVRRFDFRRTVDAYLRFYEDSSQGVMGPVRKNRGDVHRQASPAPGGNGLAGASGVGARQFRFRNRAAEPEKPAAPDGAEQGTT